MKKFLLFLISLSLTFILIIVSNIMFQNKKITMNSSLNNDNKVLSMMIETNASSGIYQESKDSVWPTTDYTFNSSLSKCENGSTLTWDNATKKVLMKGNVSDKCYVYFDAPQPPLADYIKSLYTSQGANGLYYHDSTLANGAGDYSYRYAGADYVLSTKGSSYNSIGSYSKDERNSLIIRYCDVSIVDLDYRCFVPEIYQLAYDNANDFSTYQEAIKQAFADGYVENNIKNYVCFGSTTKPCPAANLYRIIGVFDDHYVKLIKADYANEDQLGTNGNYVETLYDGFYETYLGNQALRNIGLYNWGVDDNIDNINDWLSSDLNIVNLNTNYINELGTTWTDKIASSMLIVGGNSTENIVDVLPSVTFENEVINPVNGEILDGAIGLMYVSDYGYAADPRAWKSTLNDYGYGPTSIGIDWITASNWMYLGLPEWTISHETSPSIAGMSIAFYINEYGNVVPEANAFAARPVFYLTPSVTYVSGSGTENDPILIN